MSCNTPLWPLLGLTGGRISPIRSIGWPCQALVPICFITTILLNLHLQQVPNLYQWGARRRWLRVNCVERIGIWPVLRTWNWQPLGTLPSTRVYWSRISISTKANGIPSGFILNTSWTRWWVMERRASEKYAAHMASSNKKSKRNLSESDSENEAADFPKFIVIEPLKEVCLAKFLPFLIEKVISTRASPKTVKKTRNGNLLVEVDSRRQAENILKIKTFHTTKCRAYPHEKLNTSKGVIRSRELASATEEEITSALGKQGVTNIRRISIRKGEERIQTNTDIMTFNKPRALNEVKIGYCLERVEQYVPAPLRCFKWKKYGHHREACRGRQTCAKCGEKDPDNVVEDCLKEIICANCRQDHPAYTRSCVAYKKKKKK